jgi:hypothetical protein
LTCKSFSHSINCKYHNNNALKGASAVVNQQQPKQLVFNKSELNIVSKTLELCKYFVGKNQNLYQNPQDILNEISTSINILSARQNNNNKSNLKGASNICNKKEYLTDLLKQFNLI